MSSMWNVRESKGWVFRVTGKSNLKYKIGVYSQRENRDLRSGQIWVKNPAFDTHMEILDVNDEGNYVIIFGSELESKDEPICN